MKTYLKFHLCYRHTLLLQGVSKKCLNVRQKLGTRNLIKNLKSEKLEKLKKRSLPHTRSHTLSFTHSWHAEQLFFPYLCSNVKSHYLTLIHSLSTCWTTFVLMSKLKSHSSYVKMTIDFFDSLLTLSWEFRVHRAGSQLKSVYS